MFDVQQICDTLQSLVHLHKLKNVKNIHGGVSLIEKLQAKVCNFTTKINTPPWVFFMFFFKLYRWYQIAQRISYEHFHKKASLYTRSSNILLNIFLLNSNAKMWTEQPTYSPLPGPNHTSHIDGIEYITEINGTYSSKTICFHNCLHMKFLSFWSFMALKLSKIWKFYLLAEEINK